MKTENNCISQLFPIFHYIPFQMNEKKISKSIRQTYSWNKDGLKLFLQQKIDRSIFLQMGKH